MSHLLDVVGTITLQLPGVSDLRMTCRECSNAFEIQVPFWTKLLLGVLIAGTAWLAFIFLSQLEFHFIFKGLLFLIVLYSLLILYDRLWNRFAKLVSKTS